MKFSQFWNEDEKSVEKNFIFYSEIRKNFYVIIQRSRGIKTKARVIQIKKKKNVISFQ